MSIDDFFARGWARFSFDPLLARWGDSVRSAALETRFGDSQGQWLRSGGTWFAGVNALPNDATGAIAGGPALAGAAVDFVRNDLGLASASVAFDPAQVSICYPGYPQRSPGESASAFGYRVHKCAAHIDGVLPEGDKRRRHLRGHHQFILGIPLTPVDEGSSPLVVWEGSHHLVRQTLRQCYDDLPGSAWGNVDVTEVYWQLRDRIFAECEPVAVVAEPGQSYVIHRLALHGIAPWRGPATESSDARVVCYFRPETTSPQAWLRAP